MRFSGARRFGWLALWGIAFSLQIIFAGLAHGLYFVAEKIKRLAAIADDKAQP